MRLDETKVHQKLDLIDLKYEAQKDDFDDHYFYYRMHFNLIENQKEYVNKLNKKNEVLQQNIQFHTNKLKKMIATFPNFKDEINKRIESFSDDLKIIKNKMIVFS